MRTLFCLLLPFLLGAGCSSTTGEDDFDPEIRRDDVARISLEAGIHRHAIPAGSGRELDFLLAVPPLTQGERVPLVVVLHYNANAEPAELAEIYLRTVAEPGLRDLGAILFAPAVPGLTWTDPASGKAVMDFVEHAVATWPVDPARIVVTGYSMGGVGTWFFTTRYPEVFSAGIPIAGRPIGDLSGGVPLYIIHGRLDDLFPVAETEEAAGVLQNAGVNVELVIVEGLGHNQATGYVNALQGAVPWVQERVWGN